MTPDRAPDPAKAALSAWLDCCVHTGWFPRASSELVDLQEAVGRTTASTVYALWSSPAEERAAMDGIAVTTADTVGACNDAPVRLAAEMHDVVDTGDPMPPGRDAVIMREHLRRIPDGSVEITVAVAVGKHVRPVGEDVASGELLLPAGHRVRPVDIAVAAGAGHTRLAVRQRPVVMVIPTGDEVRPLGTTIGLGEVLDTNSLMLMEMAREAGCEAYASPVTPDQPAALSAAVLDAAEHADLILVIAGSSGGRDDHTTSVLATLGKVAVHGVAIRPGHPVVLGVVDTPTPVPAIGVPGYPVSAIHVFGMFAKPLIEILGISLPAVQPSMTATLAGSISSPAHLDESIAVRLEVRVGTVYAKPAGRGASALSAFMRAEGIIRVPVGTSGLSTGDEVLVDPLPGAPTGLV